MTELVTCVVDDGIAEITMDDGKANVMSLAMIGALADAFRRAEADGAVTVLTGRGSVFSAGYDMALFDRPVEEILAHPFPVIAACNGHAIAQGAFTLLACDVRLGIRGEAKIGLNEVAIGLTIPHYGVELARHRLAPTWFDHATLTGALYEPGRAQVAGFLHELVDPADLGAAVRGRATAHPRHGGSCGNARPRASARPRGDPRTPPAGVRASPGVAVWGRQSSVE